MLSALFGKLTHGAEECRGLSAVCPRYVTTVRTFANYNFSTVRQNDEHYCALKQTTVPGGFGPLSAVFMIYLTYWDNAGE